MIAKFIAPLFEFYLEVPSKSMEYKIYFPAKIEPMNSLEGNLIQNHGRNVLMVFRYEEQTDRYIYDRCEAEHLQDNRPRRDAIVACYEIVGKTNPTIYPDSRKTISFFRKKCRQLIWKLLESKIQ